MQFVFWYCVICYTENSNGEDVEHVFQWHNDGFETCMILIRDSEYQSLFFLISEQRIYGKNDSW